MCSPVDDITRYDSIVFYSCENPRGQTIRYVYRYTRSFSRLWETPCAVAVVGNSQFAFIWPTGKYNVFKAMNQRLHAMQATLHYETDHPQLPLPLLYLFIIASHDR